jgi:hypothetical protein
MNNGLKFLIIKIVTALLDFILITSSFFISILLVREIFGGLHAFILQDQFNDKLITHVLISLLCSLVLDSTSPLLLQKTILV